MAEKRVIVLGGGPGGYSAAIYLAHLGAKVTLVEKQYLGGTCLNVGCIPTKAFVEAASQYAAVQSMDAYGILLDGSVSVDGKKLAKFKNRIVRQLCSGVGYLLEAAGEARVAALHIVGGGRETADYSAVPYCIFSSPEVARVGMTEEEAREKYPHLQVEKESFSGNGKAMIHQENTGFVKLLIDGDSGKVVGCSIIGPKATELIAEPSLAVKLGLDAQRFSQNINAHPSLSEMIGETAAAAVGLKLHSI